MAPSTRKASKRGIWKNSRTYSGATSDDNLVDKVADFSYESDALAQLIVEMWLNQHGDLITPAITSPPNQQDCRTRAAAAKTTLAAFGIHLEQPFVVTEAEYEAGVSLEDCGLPSAVVLVVPDVRRATPAVAAPPAGAFALVETAKMLMAVTPNGI